MSPRLTAALLIGMMACAPQHDAAAPADAVHAWYSARIDSLAGVLDDLTAHAADDTPDSTRIRHAFARARLHYKRIEHLAEHYNPVLADAINGPPIAEVEPGDPNRIVIPAEGFQVVEELLYPEITPDVDELREEIAILRVNVLRLRTFARATQLSDENILESVRLQLARIFTLGLSGFDSPAAAHSLPEAAAALDGLSTTLRVYAQAGAVPAEDATALFTLFDDARATLESGAGFDDFDRLGFLTGHMIPLHEAVHRFRDVAGIAPPATPSAWRADVPSPYHEDAFDATYFSPAIGTAASHDVVALGRALFHEPALSGTGAHSCATCHDPAQAFADGHARSPAVDPGRTTRRNAPTLINAALQHGNFADLRTVFLEDQVADVLANPDEMASSLEDAAARLSRLPRWRTAFGDVFQTDGVLPSDVQHALAAYVRSLVALDSPFDRYVRGERSALNDSEKRGFNVFMGRAGCGTCHFAPLFSGAVPPVYAKTELEVIGVPAHPDTMGAEIDADDGSFPLHRNPLHRFAFRTPTVRNVEHTAPYMHNGVYASLDQVVDFYVRGGGAGIGIDLDNQTLPPEPLELTDRQREDLIAFMHALTDADGAARFD